MSAVFRIAAIRTRTQCRPYLLWVPVGATYGQGDPGRGLRWDERLRVIVRETNVYRKVLETD